MIAGLFAFLIALRKRASKFFLWVSTELHRSEDDEEEADGIPDGGFQPIKFRSAFSGQDREGRLIGLHGCHVAVQTCDDGPPGFSLIMRSHVHPGSLKVYDRFVTAEVKKMSGFRLAGLPGGDPVESPRPE